MNRFMSGLGEWWRWRMLRARVHIYGIAEYSQVGTVIKLEDGYWRIEDDQERPVYVHGAQPSAADLRAGDRVEVEPIMQGSGWSVGVPMIPGAGIPYGFWQIRRKLDDSQA